MKAADFLDATDVQETPRIRAEDFLDSEEAKSPAETAQSASRALESPQSIIATTPTGQRVAPDLVPKPPEELIPSPTFAEEAPAALKLAYENRALSPVTALKFDIKPDENKWVAAGKEAVNVILGIPEFFTSPQGVATAAAAPVSPLLTTAAFTGDMLYGLGKQIYSSIKDWDKMTPAQHYAAVVDMLGTGALAGWLGRSTAKGIKTKLTSKPKPTEAQNAEAIRRNQGQLRQEGSAAGEGEAAGSHDVEQIAQVQPEPVAARKETPPQAVKPPPLTAVPEPVIMWSSADPKSGKPTFFSDKQSDAEAYSLGRTPKQYQVQVKNPFDSTSSTDAELMDIFNKAGGIQEAPRNPKFIAALKAKGYDSIIGGETGMEGPSTWIIALDKSIVKPVTKPVESSDIPVEKKGVVPETQPEVVPQKRPVMNMAGQVRQKRPPFLGPPAFETLHPNAQAKFNAAWDAKDATAMKELLHLQNKGLRGEFAKRTGIKLPNTQGGTKTTIDSWAKGAFDKNKEPVVTPAPSEQSLPPTGGVSETGAASTTPPVIEKISTTKGKGQGEPKIGDVIIHYSHKDGKGLLDRSALDLSKLTENEELELPELLDYGLQQPLEVPMGSKFYFTEQGLKKHARLIKLIRKASKSGGLVKETTKLKSAPLWKSRDGQIAISKTIPTNQPQPPMSGPGSPSKAQGPDITPGQHRFSDKVEAEIRYQIKDVGYDTPEDIPSRNEAVRRLMEDMDDPNHYASEFKKELQDYGIQIGIYKPYTKEQLSQIEILGRGKKYDFKRGGLYYIFDSWEPLEKQSMGGPGSPSRKQGPDTGPGWMSSDTADDSVSGVADRVRKLRENSGKTAPTVPGEGIAPEASVERGNELLGKGANPDAIMANFEATKRASSDDMAIVRAQQTVLSRITNRTEEKFGTESPEYKAAYNTESAWAARTKAMQTEWARAGHAQQGEVDIDTGTFTGLRRAVRDVTGKDLTPSQTVKAKAVAAKVSEAEKAVEPAKVNLQNAIDNLDERGVPIYSDYVLKLAEKIVSKLDARAEASRKALRDMSMRFNAGVDPTVLYHLANIGASHIAHFGLDRVKWADAMIRDVGPKVKPYLADIFNRSQQLVDAEAELHGPAKEQVRSVVKKTRTQRAPADLDSQRKVFGNFVEGKEMNPEQVKTLWQRAKSEYIDKGVDDFAEIVNKLATDFGIPKEDVLRGLNQKKSIRRVADDVWQKQRQARLLKSAAKRWVDNTNETILQKALPTAVRTMFSAKVALHGTVAIGTHAPLEAFVHPVITAKNFGKMYRMVASPEYYQMQQYELARRPNYNVAQRNGLVNDMSKMEDFNDPALAQGFPKMAEWFKQKLAKVGLSRLQGMGTRGYGVLKILRQDLFDNEWNKLAESERTPDMAKAIADSVNHMTGVVKANVHPAANVALFAPKLLLSRLQVMGGDPFKAVNSLLHMREMTPEQKWFATNQLKEKAKIFGVATGLLIANQQLNKLFGDDKKLNGVPEVLGGGGINPMASDFMKFRVAGMNFAWGSPFLTMMRLPLRIIQIGMGSGGKSRFLIYPDESMSYEVFKYLRSQSSPFAQPILSLVTKTDFQGRPLPQIPGYGQPPPVPKRLRAQGVEPYTWKEFAAETMLPIPFQEAAKEVFHYLKMGTTEQKEKSLLKALTVVLIMGGTGGRLSEDWNPETGKFEPTKFNVFSE